MARVLRRLAGLCASLALLIGALLTFLNTAPGFRLIERCTPFLSDGEVALSGLSGRFPDRLRVAHIEVIDPGGIWMNAKDLELDWSPRGLLHGRVDIDRVSIRHSDILRKPDYPEDPEEDNSLPLFFAFRDLVIVRLDLAPAVAGTGMALRLKGSGDMSALDRGSADLTLERIDAPGSYRLNGEAGPDGARLRATLDEPPQGLLASLAGLPDLGAIAGAGTLEGPWNASRATVNLAAGPLRAEVLGSIDWIAETLKLAVTLNAPSMKPRPDLAWQTVVVKGQVDGAFAGPAVSGHLQMLEVKAGNAAARQVTADLRGDAARLHVQGEISALRIPGPNPALLEGHPLTLAATMDLRAAERPVTFNLQHRLLRCEGSAVTNGKRTGEAVVTLPALGPLLAPFAMDLQGAATIALKAAEQAAAMQIEASGTLSVTGGAAPLPALIGTDATFQGAAQLRGADLTLPSVRFAGKAFALNAEGHVDEQAVALKLKLALGDLKALSADLRGHLDLQGSLSGRPTAMALDAALAGELAARGFPSGPLTAQLKILGLPDQPTGTLNAQGSLDAAPLALSLAAAPGKAGDIGIRLDRFDWKSLHAAGTVTLPRGAAIPIGQIEARIGQFEDLSRLAGMPLTGAGTVRVETTQRDRFVQAQLRADGQRVGVEGTAAADHLGLQATVQDPLARPVFNGQLVLDGLRNAGAEGSLRIDVSGPAEALVTRLHADLPRLHDAPARLAATATVNTVQRELELGTLQASWRDEVLRLRRAAHIGFGDNIELRRLNLGWRQASLEVDGRIAPELELSADLRDLPADVAALVAPELAVDGRLQASARLSGTPRQPRGTVHLDVNGVQVRTSAARGLPPLSLAARAQLDGGSARVEGRLTGGTQAQLAIHGDLPLQAGNPLDLHADGTVDLKLMDPFLMAQGRRVRGRLVLNAGVRGTLAEPAITGGLQLAQGEFEDYTMGLRLSDLAASLLSDGDTIRIERFEAHAGPGRIDVRGSVGVLQRQLPIDLTLTARNARPLSSDRMTVTLDSNLALRGDAQQRLAAVGNIHIRRAEIRIPEHIPATIAVLDVREPGASPPPPPKAGPDIGVDLTLDATDEIFVRGRGLDAEMSGKIHLLGTANNPQPNGRFAMRRGQFTLMGKTLTFSRGEVGFDGGTLTNPTLDFIANSTNNNITATLAVGGTARKPKITLTSVPQLPQDEILAQLLFGRGSAALSPLELAQIAGALASLTGVTSGLSNPLETVRKGLGLDRLAVGSTKAGAPTLEAGRYVAPGVYLGAKQGFSGGSAIPQAAVQIDVTEGLKLEGTVGAGNNNADATSTGASSAGVLYQFEY